MAQQPAMEEVYRRYADTVYRFLLSQTRDAHLAEELTQETFCRAVASIERYDGSCKLSVWLCQIAKHLWYQELRRRGRRPAAVELGPDVEAELAVPSVEEDIIAREGHLELLRSIHQLPDPQREVVYLRAFGGLSFRQIGDVMGKTETWARVNFYRGKEKLRLQSSRTDKKGELPE